MSIPGWVLEIFATVMLLVAEVSAGQLVAARAWTRPGGAGADLAVSRVLTGIALAGILVPGLAALPDAAWEAVFAVMTAWFAWGLWRQSRGRGAAVAVRGHYLPHLVRGAAMLYLFAARAAPSATGPGLPESGTGGMSGMAGGESGGSTAPQAPALALVFALLVIAFTVCDLDRQAGADAVVKGGQAALGVTLAFILVTIV